MAGPEHVPRPQAFPVWWEVGPLASRISSQPLLVSSALTAVGTPGNAHLGACGLASPQIHFPDFHFKWPGRSEGTTNPVVSGGSGDLWGPLPLVSWQAPPLGVPLAYRSQGGGGKGGLFGLGRSPPSTVPVFTQGQSLARGWVCTEPGPECHPFLGHVCPWGRAAGESVRAGSF